MNTISGFELVFTIGIRLSKALMVRICASSNTSMSAECNPRPNPFSRAPNMIRQPLLNLISCWPFARRTFRTYLDGFGLRVRSRMSANVSSEVRVWCAVQMTSVPAHRMNIAVPAVKVLPIRRQLDNTAPPEPQAYLLSPSNRLPGSSVMRIRSSNSASLPLIDGNAFASSSSHCRTTCAEHGMVRAARYSPTTSSTNANATAMP